MLSFYFRLSNITSHRLPQKQSRSLTSGLHCLSSALLLCMSPFHHLTNLSNRYRFLLGQVIGSILLAPWSEAFGRKKLYIASSGIISICCVIVGVAPSIAAVVVGRFIAGLLSAIPCNVGVGSVEDLFRSKERIWVVFIWMIASNIGLIIGPIMSSYIIASLDWYVSFLSAQDRY